MVLHRLIDALRPYRFPGKARLLGPLVARNGLRRAKVFGSDMELDLSDLIQRGMYLGAYERKETVLLFGYLRPGMVVIDVGANVGYYTLAAASRVGKGGIIFSVEPSPYAAERLERTVRENHLDQVRVVRAALGDHAGQHVLFTPLPGNHTPTMLGEPGAEGIPVPVRTLDECVETWQVSVIDLLKIDVEGYEPSVLRGAASLLAAGRIRAILCEFNDFWLRRAGSASAKLYGSLIAAGFVDVEGRPRRLDNAVVNRLLVHETRLQGTGGAEPSRLPRRGH